jgi:hypothetical protein
MSLAEIKKEAVELSQTERGELMSFLAAVQIAEDEDLRMDLTAKMDAPMDQWIPLGDLQKRWKN